MNMLGSFEVFFRTLGKITKLLAFLACVALVVAYVHHIERGGGRDEIMRLQAERVEHCLNGPNHIGVAQLDKYGNYAGCLIRHKEFPGVLQD